MWNAKLERDKLLHLEQRLKNHVIGQDEAVRAVTKAVRRSRTGVRNPTRPLASFLFAGPPAVGKTTLANALAIEFYGSKDHLILFEMSDYDYKDFVSQLTESIIRNPRSVVLFSKIEKARHESGDALLRIIDGGTLAGRKGQADFSKAIIAMEFDIVQPELILSFRAGNARQSISHFLSGVFGAEISNRVDEILMFNEVAREDVEKMVDFMVSDLAKRIKRLGERSIEVEVTEGMKNRVVEEGYDPPTSGGAKPLKSAFARLVENPLADAVLERES